MSNTPPGMPQIVDQGLDLAPYRPSKAQTVAKARLQAHLASRAGLVAVEAMTQAELVAVSGDRRVAKWLQDPSFAAWFTDRDTFVTQAASMKEAALAVLEDIILGDMDPKLLTAKDKLKAIDILFNLTGAYPKHNQVRFLDRDLEQMDEASVDRELLKAGVDPARLR